MVSPPLPVRVVINAQDGTRVSGVVTYEPTSGAISTGISGQFGVRNDGGITGGDEDADPGADGAP